jgi:uncharacterized membrane protein
MSVIKDFIKNEKYVIGALLFLFALVLINSTAFFSTFETIALLVVGILGAYFVMNKGIELTTR